MRSAVAAITMTSMDQDTATTPQPVADAPAVDEELLIEEISIDGMCGVY